MADGGVMSMDECTEIRLPSETLDDDDSDSHDWRKVASSYATIEWQCNLCGKRTATKGERPEPHRGGRCTEDRARELAASSDVNINVARCYLRAQS